MLNRTFLSNDFNFNIILSNIPKFLTDAYYYL